MSLELGTLACPSLMFIIKALAMKELEGSSMCSLCLVNEKQQQVVSGLKYPPDC